MLNILVVGFNHKLSCAALKEIARNDESKIESNWVFKDEINMEDGTRYFTCLNPMKLKGQTIDQLIVVDDFRWKVYWEQNELLAVAKERMLNSCVPEEFQVQHYDYPVASEAQKEKYIAIHTSKIKGGSVTAGKISGTITWGKILKIKRDFKKICTCKHARFTIDTENRLVTCSDCGSYVDPFNALIELAKRPERLNQEIEHLKNEHKELSGYVPKLRIIKSIQKSYMNGEMMPKCPKCGDYFELAHLNTWGNKKYYKKESD